MDFLIETFPLKFWAFFFGGATVILFLAVCWINIDRKPKTRESK